MATQIFVKQNGEYFAGRIDLSEQLIDGEREQGAWIDRTDYLESDNWFKRNIWHRLLLPKEFHAIIAKGNRIHNILGDW